HEGRHAEYTQHAYQGEQHNTGQHVLRRITGVELIETRGELRVIRHQSGLDLRQPFPTTSVQHGQLLTTSCDGSRCAQYAPTTPACPSGGAIRALNGNDPAPA